MPCPLRIQPNIPNLVNMTKNKQTSTFVGNGGGWGEGRGVPKMVSLINNKNKQRNRKSEKTPKTKIRLVIYNNCSLVYEKVKMILWSIRTVWYTGLAKKQGKIKFETNDCFSKK